MARLKRGGATFTALFEYEISLSDLIAELGLLPLSPEQEDVVREKLGRAIGQWYQEVGDYNASGAKLDTTDVAATLRMMSAHLDTISPVLSAATCGGLHHAHALEVANHLISALELNPAINDRERAKRILTKFLHDADTIAEAARLGAHLLSAQTGVRGRTPLRWHILFHDAVVFVCKSNGIAPSISTHRITGERLGRFFQIAKNLQRVLSPEMRANKDETLVARLKKSRMRAKAGPELDDVGLEL